MATSDLATIQVPKLSLVQIELIHAVMIPSHPEYSSVVGHVIEVSPAVERVAVGDRVITIAPYASSITISEDDCLRLNDEDEINETTAFWALALTLIPVVRLGELAIGERVLVLSNDLLGQMITDLVWSAGAGSCVAFDRGYSGSNDYNKQSAPPAGLYRVSEIGTLDSLITDNSADLLIDVTGDLPQLQKYFTRVSDTGRILMVRRFSSPKIDFNAYSDLHRRSLKFLSGRIPRSLNEMKQDYEQQSFQLEQKVDFVRHLFETKRLDPSLWSYDYINSNSEIPHASHFSTC